MSIYRTSRCLVILCLISPSAMGAEPRIATRGNLPLSFVRQGDSFRARGQGYSIGLEAGTASIQALSGSQPRSISIGFAGAQKAMPVEGKKLSGVVNFISGNDRRKWQIGLPTFDRVTYPELYPGIDVVYYGNQQQLEFDLVVRPGADPRAIRMKVQGGGKLLIDHDGALEIAGLPGLRIRLPKIYQEVNGSRKPVAGHFSIREKDEVGLDVQGWNRASTLVIDPSIAWSTVLGGGLGTSSAVGIAVDPSQNVLVVGYTTSSDFPLVNPTRTNPAFTDGFVSKLNPNGTALIYSTFFGGNGTDTPRGVVIDSAGAAWITGSTTSGDFPLVNAAQSISGNSFLMKIGQSGSPLFSTYLGRGGSYAYAVATDPSGNGYVTGYATLGFPTTAGVLQSSTTGTHAFVSKYSPTGSIIYATMLGGSGADYPYGIAADSDGDAYVTGLTSSSSFTGAPAGGAQTTNQGNGDGFVAKLKSDGTALLYFTFLGGTSADEGLAITVDSSLNAYVAGQTASAGLATTGAAQTKKGGATDGFIAKLNPAGSTFSYLTYLGGSRQDYPKAIAPDGAGNIYVTGSTESTDFPVVSPVQPAIGPSTTALFSTRDAGATWAPADSGIPGAVFDISFNPAGTSAVAVTESGIYRSTDGGTTWTQQLNVPQASRMTMSRSLADPSTIYVASCCDSLLSSQTLTVYRSSDDGVTWSSPGTRLLSSAATVVADPGSANTVYLRDLTSMAKSIDGGSSWSGASNPAPTSSQTTTMIAASDGALYAAAGSVTSLYDVFKSTNGARSWIELNAGVIFAGAIYSHQLSAAGNTVSFAANAIYQTMNGGRNWTTSKAPEAVYELEISPKDPSVQYALGSDGYVLRTLDGGVTWSSTSMYLNLTGSLNTAIGSSKIVIDPSDASHVFVIAPVNSAAFVAKLKSDGSSFQWSTFLGGAGTASGTGIAADGAGDAWITGNNGSAVFPVTIPALSGTSIFAAKISDASGDCAPLLKTPDQTITGKSQSLNFGVVAPSGCNWTASTDADWATVTSGASATGTALVTIQAAENSGVSSRTATLTAGSNTVKIVQAGDPCSYSLDAPPSLSIPNEAAYSLPIAGGSVTAVLTATDGCPWTVTNPYPSAITITSGASGTGSGTIQFTVSPNTTTGLRTFNLYVGTAWIRVEQMYAAPQSQSINFPSTPDQTLDFAPPPLKATAGFGTTVTFTSNTPSVCQVSGTTVTLIATGTCSITATQPGNLLYLPATPVTQTFAVTAGPAVPQPTGGIANAASAGQATPSVVGIGSYVAIYGRALGDNGGTPSASALPLPALLNGTQVTLGGLPMPLLYAGTGQVNALVPMGLKPHQSYPMVVTRDGISSAPVSLTVEQLQPGIYTVNTTGSGAGIVTNSLTGQLITQSNPAKAGDYLTIYCTGLGPLHGPNGEAGPGDGAAAPLNLLYSTNATVTATVGTTDVPALFSGLTPGLAALYQVNIQMPSLGDIYGTVTVTLALTAKDSQLGVTARSNSVQIYLGN